MRRNILVVLHRTVPAGRGAYVERAGRKASNPPPEGVLAGFACTGRASSRTLAPSMQFTTFRSTAQHLDSPIFTSCLMPRGTTDSLKREERFRRRQYIAWSGTSRMLYPTRLPLAGLTVESALPLKMCVAPQVQRRGVGGKLMWLDNIFFGREFAGCSWKRPCCAPRAFC